MTHLAHETLVAFVDGELSAGTSRQTERHIAGCRSCAETLTQLDQSGTLFAYALRWVDEAEPTEWKSGLAAVADLRARAPSVGLRPFPGPQGATAASAVEPSHPPVWRWAAGLVLLSGAAAAAIVGPDLVGRMIAGGEAPAAVEQPTDAVRSSGALAIEPLEGIVDIALNGSVQGTRIQLVFEERSDVLVDFLGEVPGAVARDGHLALRIAAPGTHLRVTIPTDLASGRILVDGEEVAVMARGRITNIRSDRGIIIDTVTVGR